MEIIDTNILYYKYTNPKYSIEIEGKKISSINALEFLKNIEKIHTNSAKFYIPLNSGLNFHLAILLSKFHKKRAFNKSLSDYITFEFNNDFPSYNLYNNISIKQVINYKQKELLKASINFLPKENCKDIYSKYNFLIDYNLDCISLEQSDIDLALELLYKFLTNHSLKDDFRNCWNDLLIASIAVNRNMNLISKDKLLNQFVSLEFGIRQKRVTKKITEYDFSSNEVTERKHEKFESKGYINRSWNYRLKTK
ncbi:hypothetical protein J2X69_003638 [Algoriphagus sp. 4150]|uniref:hypothetical protein n=1 Tax=Algoriphagus sp. 4150 TaxID=2817756 RepID=UPI0028616072|nr:hypothetical protein [Algoriphagus sp. 4150]MDR7131277.1 hypothetical protein [Algoriphagus sp. 4150]